MAKVINCECGQTVRADNDEELVDRAMQHVRDQHPDMADTITREQLLSMSEEE